MLLVLTFFSDNSKEVTLSEKEVLLNFEKEKKNRKCCIIKINYIYNFPFKFCLKVGQFNVFTLQFNHFSVCNRQRGYFNLASLRNDAKIQKALFFSLRGSLTIEPFLLFFFVFTAFSIILHFAERQIDACIFYFNQILVLCIFFFKPQK